MIFNLTRDTITSDLKRKLAQVQRPRTIIAVGAINGVNKNRGSRRNCRVHELAAGLVR